MENNVMVSVIMLSYNHAKFIRQAIESVLMQKTSHVFELLIGDDASSDESAEIIREYEKKYPHIIRATYRSENIGTTKNAFDLFQKANGKYLASCESDDFWTDEKKLQVQVDFLESHPDYVGCSHNVSCVDINGKPTAQQQLRWITNKKVYSLRDFKGIILPGHSCSLVRRNIFSDPDTDYSIFWKSSKYIGDRTGALLFAAKGNFYRINAQMASYRQTVGDGYKSLTWKLYHDESPKWIIRELEYTRILEEYAEEILDKNVYFDYYRSELFVSALYRFIKTGDNGIKAVMHTILKQMKSPAMAWINMPGVIIRKFLIKSF